MGLGASPGTPAHQLGALALTQGDPGLLVCPTGGPTGVGGSYGDGACHRALRSPQRVCSDHCLRPQASGPSTQIPAPPRRKLCRCPLDGLAGHAPGTQGCSARRVLCGTVPRWWHPPTQPTCSSYNGHGQDGSASPPREAAWACNRGRSGSA